MTRTSIRTVLSVALAVTLLAIGASGSVLAAAEDGQAGEAVDRAPRTTVDSAKGKQLKVAKSQVAKNWTRLKDPTGDQVTRDGNPALDAEPWTDLTTVSVVRAAATLKMMRVLGEDYPLGTVGSYYGADADWQDGDEAFFIVAKTAGKLPRSDDTNVQLIVTFDGDAAVPLHAGSLLGPYDGAESFSLSGAFPGGSWASGTTNLEGWLPTEPMPFYNGPSLDLGYYDRKNAAFIHAARVPEDATSATVTLRAESADGEIFDEVHLPAGGRFLGLGSPTWGLNIKKDGVPLACRAVDTVSAGAPGAEDLEPGMNLVRYTVGWNKGSDVSDEVSGLGATTQVELIAAGSSDEPTSVDAAVEVDAATKSATFEVLVPDGQWLIGSPEDARIKTPGGQSVIDLRPLTGSGGLLTGPGLDGFVAGDETCGR